MNKQPIAIIDSTAGDKILQAAELVQSSHYWMSIKTLLDEHLQANGLQIGGKWEASIIRSRKPESRNLILFAGSYLQCVQFALDEISKGDSQTG
jgi:hypothetical protein